MESNRIEYEKPEMELFLFKVNVITKSLGSNGSSNDEDDVVYWPT